MRLWLFVLCVGCGRIAFDPLDDGDGGTGGGDDAALACLNVPSCPDQMLNVGLGMMMTTEVNDVDHGLSSTMCNTGTGNNEITVQVTPQRTGNYTVTSFGLPVTVYVLDGCCGGPELKCGLSTLSLQRNVGTPFVVVVEGQAGATLSLQVANL